MDDGQVLGTITVDGEEIQLIRLRYADGRPAVRGIVAATGEPFGSLSTNPGPEIELPADCIAVKTWSENAYWWQAAAMSGLFMITGQTLGLGGFGAVAPVWRILEPQS